MNLPRQLAHQHFPNEYQLVNGVAMHAENPDNFLIPHPVLKTHVGVGYFVELRLDSPRFSVHENAPEKCTCPTCNGEMTKPILGHEHPASLLRLPKQNIPSRGWGEDFWVRIAERDGRWFIGVVDNDLVESRLHGLRLGSSVVFQEDHILAVHGVHRDELLRAMNEADVLELAAWYRGQKSDQVD